MVVFALSCFGLLLFLWLSFGGPIPLKPEGYRFSAAFPEAATLAEEADVRISGVTVGTVKTKELDKVANRTNVVIELDEKYAPIPTDTRAILRQKTLLGETYVELTPGDQNAPKLPEGGALPNSSVAPTVELDEILRIFNPKTKKAFRQFSHDFATVTKGTYAEDLNDAFGNLAGTATDGADVLEVLDRQEKSVRLFVRNTGVVFGALNERQGALRELIGNANNVFEATAQQRDALAQTFEIFPTFLQESRATLGRLDTFSANTRPLIVNLKPVADDLGPTVRDLGDLAPDLRDLLHDLDPLVDASRQGLPAAERVLRGARPLFKGLHQFLPELNPILAFANYGQVALAQFLTSGSVAVIPGGNPGRGPHGALPQFAMIDGRSLHLSQDQTEFFRGNAYPAPNYIKRARAYGAFETFSCSNAGGQEVNPDTPGDAPPCFEAPKTLFSGTHYPQVRGGNRGIWNAARPPAFSPTPLKNDGTSCKGPGNGAVGKGSRNPIQLCSESRSAPFQIPGSRPAP
jgi:phospholipid/cholesterol/gamma-HCH transport system substrate-binding protein